MNNLSKPKKILNTQISHINKNQEVNIDSNNIIKFINNNNYSEIYLDIFGTLNVKLYNNQYFNIINNNNNKITNLKLNNELVIVTASQLNYNNVSKPGIAESNKTLVINTDREIKNIQLLSSKYLEGILLTQNQPNIKNIGILDKLSTYGNVNIISHNNTTTGLMLCNKLVKASADELNILSGILTTTNELNYLSHIQEGKATPSKVLLLDKNKDIIGINTIKSNIIYGIIYSDTQPYIKYLNNLDSISINKKINIVSDYLNSGLFINNKLVKLSADELNLLVGLNINSNELNKLKDLQISSNELNKLKDLQISSNELNKLKDLQISSNELNKLKDLQVSSNELNKLKDLQISSNELNKLKDLQVSSNELNKLKDLQTSSSILNKLKDLQVTSIELNKLSGLITTTEELNKFSGLNISTEKLNKIFNIKLGYGKENTILSLDNNRDIVNINTISVNYINGVILTEKQPKIKELGILEYLTINGNVNIISHNGLNYGLHLNGELIKSNAREINILSGLLSSTQELNTLFGLVSTTEELNKLNGLKSSTEELNKLNGLISTTEELNKLHGLQSTTEELNSLSNVEFGKSWPNKALIVDENRNIININKLESLYLEGTIMNSHQINITKIGNLEEFTSYGNVNIASHNGKNIGLQLNGILIKSTADEINILSGLKINTNDLNKLYLLKASTSELNKLHGLLSSTNELNKLHGLLPSKDELNKLHGLLSSTNELNKLHGLLSSTNELNYLANIQQGIGQEFKALILNANRSISNIHTLSSIYLEGILLSNNQPNITSVGKLSNLTVNGNIEGVKRLITDEIILNGAKILSTAKEINKLSGSTITKNELNYLSNALIGMAMPLKSLVMDYNNDITGIRNFEIIGNSLSNYSTWGIISDERVHKYIQDINIKDCYNIIKNIKLEYHKINNLNNNNKNNLLIRWNDKDLKQHLPNSLTNIVNKSLNLDNCQILNTDIIYNHMFGAIQQLINDKEQLENKLIYQNTFFLEKLENLNNKIIQLEIEKKKLQQTVNLILEKFNLVIN
jgi:hypothetical protein